jgi:hypothetical protein
MPVAEAMPSALTTSTSDDSRTMLVRMMFSGSKMPEQALDHCGRPAVETSSGFVGDDDGRVVSHRSCNGGALLFAPAREPSWM